MISSIRFKPPYYASALPLLKDRDFTFSSGPGLTFLYGPNGSGKSTIIKGLAHGSAIMEKGGWSQPIEPVYYRGKQTTHGVLTEHADVVWDGTPSFFLDSTVSDNTGSTIELEDGLGDAFRSGIQRFATNPSSGEWRIQRIVDLIRELNKKEFPDLTKPEWEGCNNTWSAVGVQFADHVRTLARTGVPTLLLDEPDRSLSLPRSRELIRDLLPKMARDLQVIVATHNVFALFVPGANVVDLQPGYVEDSIKLLREAVAGSK